MPLHDLYRSTLALLTDLYQLTMAQGWWHAGMHRHQAVFHLFFRKAPFGGGFAVAAGLEPALEFLQAYRFDASDLAYLAQVRDPNGDLLFRPAFLDELGKARFDCDVHAIAEGSVVFPHQPLLRVQGPLWMAALVETPLLNLVNFQTLIATKAARVAWAAQGQPVLEFGLRRAQGIDGALAASRAAYIGGATATSNVLAGKLHGIPVRGTHAHSWVMSFDSEPAAFEAYAAAMPGNCVFLVDTYDTLQGVRHAIAVGKRLRQMGKRLVGVRLDSGDLAWLGQQARKLLDEAGFPDAAIVASNDLDENLIESLQHQSSQIAVWGVGTQLVTGGTQAALGGVYKLAALRAGPDDPWQAKVKVSEQAVKTSNPGILQVRRFERQGEFIGDVLWDELQPQPARWLAVDPSDATRRRAFDGPDLAARDLLTPVMRAGQRCTPAVPLPEIAARARSQLASLDTTRRRLAHPHGYPAGLEAGLHERKVELVLRARQART
ncbi:MAG: nicotinate phosphoribosyltransferase [Deltaproteobacteria bacterium]|nr:nicotinate phosphoribosyltransferase [Deltaproteobacteria bacterium]